MNNSTLKKLLTEYENKRIIFAIPRFAKDR